MNSSKTLLVLLVLILGLNLGLRHPRGSAQRLDPANPAEAGGAWGSTGGDASDPDAWGRGPGSRWDHAPGSEPSSFGSVSESGSTELPSLGLPLLGLPSLVRGLESAVTLEEQASWADRIALSGGSAAVEALVRASLDRRSIDEAAVLHEAFKGFSTEEEMEALASSLVQTDDLDLIEALVETLSRGARASTVERLARLHEEASSSPATRAVLCWAIERIRNPEAAQALGRWVGAPEPPDWADAGIIALSALQSQTAAAAAPSP